MHFKTSDKLDVYYTISLSTRYGDPDDDLLEWFLHNFNLCVHEVCFNLIAEKLYIELLLRKYVVYNLITCIVLKQGVSTRLKDDIFEGALYQIRCVGREQISVDKLRALFLGFCRTEQDKLKVLHLCKAYTNLTNNNETCIYVYVIQQKLEYFSFLYQKLVAKNLVERNNMTFGSYIKERKSIKQMVWRSP